VRILRDAHARWEALGRVLDAARCSLLMGESLQDEDPAEAASALDSTAERLEELGIHHLAQRARELATTSTR
jgi:hypothetical protein